ncbi:MULTISPECIES: DEAD/DEAH box helicase family protein [Thiorhodovibrio]|uniref:DEAD/DEAH box helicase family protein n=1 Tax=Thiorhodovibrio TaxID=61593 RepID=UPI001914785D|nr:MULTISPECIES: DEAD/DEAH box helicase family protein [Thiorhodovibrio]WPL11997.1 type I restriction enzyme EcoKI subunit R [Thiorhodovibrio litoralis]
MNHDWIDTYEQRRRVVQQLPILPGDEPEELPPQPSSIQSAALEALLNTRAVGYKRGLVVMATGLGKTYLAAFDTEQMAAKRVLFVAHREEILLQAEESFQRVRPNTRVGRYTGSQKDKDVDLLFASVQTLGQKRHLGRFLPNYFDYVVVDEFHHAAAATYRRLLAYFRPRFLLGLTATPERTDQSDILSLCDDNLAYSCYLSDGIELGLLCPFRYYGIYDETVDYDEIPWRNGRFDPKSLSNKLATIGRARHALHHWRDKAQTRTLAFCVSRRHADFMAERFQAEGIRAAAVYQGSTLDRTEALEQLDTGDLQVIFSVDLFNEGVDLPSIDTVLMLRPTESKVLFLQQLGRGLRRYSDKKQLVVLDFIGNHRGFLNKPQALFDVGSSYQELANFGRRARDGKLKLPPGCFANYDLAIIDFLVRLQGQGPATDYRALKDSLSRRPTLSELYRSGSNLPDLRRQHGQWWNLVRDQEDLTPNEVNCLERHGTFLREVETSNMTKCFKAVLLESLLDNDGFRHPPRVEELAAQALEVFQRRRRFIADIRQDLQQIDRVETGKWLSYWRGNPITAWTGGNKKKTTEKWFELSDGRFQPTFSVGEDEMETFREMVQELVDYRLAAYEPRLTKTETGDSIEQPAKHSANILPFRQPRQPSDGGVAVPYFPDLRIACGHFRDGRTDVEATCQITEHQGKLDPSRHFVARAVGDSMNGGKQPIRDGDYLLLELIDSMKAGSITGSLIVIERQDTSGDDQYLLRLVIKDKEGRYRLRAANPAYPDLEVKEELKTLARMRKVLNAEAIEITDSTTTTQNW